MSTSVVSLKTLGRPPIEAGPAWDSDGNIKLAWLRWMNGITTLVQIMANTSQVIVTPLSGIAGLISSGQLSVSNPNTLVFVTDYFHLMLWNGSALTFTDGGCNYYTYSDHEPVGNGWVECAGQEVSYMVEDAPYTATKVLPDTKSQVSFLSFGSTGDGSFTAAHAPTITGTCAITGTCSVTSISVSGTCSVTSISVSGSVTVSSISVSGSVTVSSVSVTGTTSTGVTGTGTTGTGTTGTGVSGATAPGFSGSGTLSGNTGFSNANLDSATFTVNEGSINGSDLSTGDVTFTVGFPTLDVFTVPISIDYVLGGGEGDCSTCEAGNLSFTYVSSVIYGSGSFTPNPHNHTVGGTASVSGTIVSGPASGQVAHDHDLSGATVSISGTVASHTHTIPGLSIPSLSIPSLSIPSLTVSASGSGSGTCTATGSGSGTCTATGTGSGTISGTGTGSGTISGTGTITATAQTNGTPRAWNMTAWFRI